MRGDTCGRGCRSECGEVGRIRNMYFPPFASRRMGHPSSVGVTEIHKPNTCGSGYTAGGALATKGKGHGCPWPEVLKRGRN